jgi:glucose/arabinose dehydrogenase
MPRSRNLASALGVVATLALVSAQVAQAQSASPAASMAAAASPGASAAPPPPMSPNATVFATGLDNPRGLEFGPDWSL